MCVEDREHLEHVHGDVWLSPHVSFVDLWAGENKTFEELPGSFAEMLPMWSGVQLKMKLISRLGCSQTASLTACSGHTKNEMGQSPDVLTEC